MHDLDNQHNFKLGLMHMGEIENGPFQLKPDVSQYKYID